MTLFDSNGKYEIASSTISNSRVAKIFRFYRPLEHEAEATIWRRQKELRATLPPEIIPVPDDQRVEDAGLELDAVLEKK